LPSDGNIQNEAVAEVPQKLLFPLIRLVPVTVWCCRNWFYT